MLCPGASTLWVQVSMPAFSGAQLAPADVVSETNWRVEGNVLLNCTALAGWSRIFVTTQVMVPFGLFGV